MSFFLTPLEVEHAILRTDGTRAQVEKVLRKEGYAAEEVDRSIRDCLKRHLVREEKNGELNVSAERRDTARRYLLLDVAATTSRSPATPSEKLTGCLLVPGYGPFQGVKLDELVMEAIRVAERSRSMNVTPFAKTQSVSCS